MEIRFYIILRFIVDYTKMSLEDFLSYSKNSEETHLQAIRGVLANWYDDRDYMTLETSGSTSEAKSILLKKDNMVRSALKTQSFFGYKESEVAMLCLPVKFIGGMMMLIRSIVSDLDLIIVKPSLRPLEFLNSDIDFLPMTTAQMAITLEKDSSQLRKVKRILLGGGPVNHSLHLQLEGIDTLCYHSFGMTETISHVAIRQLNHTGESDLFRAIKDVQFTVDKNECIIITGDHLEEPVHTNDIVELLDHQSFRWKGRKDNVINSGGIKLYPELIEAKISGLITCPYFIGSVEDDRFGNIVCLFLEILDSSLASKINDSLSLLLEGYEMPKRMYLVSQFLRTDTDKIQRNKSIELALSENKTF